MQGSFVVTIKVNSLRMSNAKICKKILDSSKLATEMCYGVILSFGPRLGDSSLFISFLRNMAGTKYGVSATSRAVSHRTANQSHNSHRVAGNLKRRVRYL